MLHFTTQSILQLLLATSVWPGSSALALKNFVPTSDGNATQPAEVAKAPAPADSSSETTRQCWKLLTDNVHDAKHTETRAQALNALSSLGSNPHAVALIAAATKDPNLDVRSAAVLAAGITRSRALLEPVRKLLGDPEPQVVFAAATTLWKQFKDKSGQDILTAIAAGDRKASPTLVHGAENDISRTLHSPSTMAKMGLQTGAGMVLGPFGFSVAAVEYMRKNGANTARVQAIDLLAEERTEGIRDQLRSALDDKDPGVRAAAVKALGNFHKSSDSKYIALLLDDSKLPVRLAAAAAYIDCLTRNPRSKTSH